jgi:hypothetical protein
MKAPPPFPIVVLRPRKSALNRRSNQRNTQNRADIVFHGMTREGLHGTRAGREGKTGKGAAAPPTDPGAFPPHPPDV